ncbi:hypothetical protein GYMLUDRAFT_57446 [Collybiopsis luxurians FD-317 M1]|uniref:Uncharacterized protein n=1 Tax=Collybiopsis luxurians FD-317 M1 TaxID=944289 RepID=A0A0D0BI91_9AGAR|nr:hypothetical protein GYMLUDRAFT_57446 [Collybiopsis luxurians FD-317 M1]
MDSEHIRNSCYYRVAISDRASAPQDHKDPSPEDLQAQYKTLGVKVRDYAYAGRVVSPIVPKTAVSANSMQAYMVANAGIDPTTRRQISADETVFPKPPTPENFDPYAAMALYVLIMQERQTEKERAERSHQPRSTSNLSITIKANEIAIPGKILHRLLSDVNWLSEKETKDWLPIDWTSLKSYGESGAAAIQPVRVLKMPSSNERRVMKSEELRKVFKKAPPTPKTKAAQRNFLSVESNPRTLPPKRGENWVHADGDVHSSSERVRTASSICEPVDDPLRSVYLEGRTGEIADSVGDWVPTREDRIAIVESNRANATFFWKCLRKMCAEKRGICLSEKTTVGKDTRQRRQKSTPQLKHGLENANDGQERKKRV